MAWHAGYGHVYRPQVVIRPPAPSISAIVVIAAAAGATIAWLFVKVRQTFNQILVR